MAVSLFTSRVMLNTLGVVDYGLNNVVGGVVTMFAFLNSAMVTASQRYITFGLAKNDITQLKVIFTTSFQIHVIIALIVVLLGETIGLWFVYNKMVIPPDRMHAALWVYHLSIVAMVTSILSVPYNSAIIAHERMGTFAIISILEVVFKLVIVYLLVLTSFDKLILLAILSTIVQILIRYIYTFYCIRHFEETSLIKVYDKALIKEMGGFACWNLLGNVAVTLNGQGLNLLINMFFGPVVNAARAVAVQVDSAVDKFSSNFLMAVNPQLTKLYAQENRTDMFSLLYRSSKFAFFLMFSLSLPIILETKPILELWLKNAPDYSVQFVQLLLIIAVINTIARPSVTLISATGDIKLYQLVIGGSLLTILPLSFVVLKLGGSPISIYIVYFIVNLIVYVIRLLFMRAKVGMSILEYTRKVIFSCLLVASVSSAIAFGLKNLMSDSILSVMIVSICTFFFVIISSYFIGMTKGEKNFVLEKVLFFISKIKTKPTE